MALTKITLKSSTLILASQGHQAPPRWTLSSPTCPRDGLITKSSRPPQQPLVNPPAMAGGRPATVLGHARPRDYFLPRFRRWHPSCRQVSRVGLPWRPSGMDSQRCSLRPPSLPPLIAGGERDSPLNISRPSQIGCSAPAAGCGDRQHLGVCGVGRLRGTTFCVSLELSALIALG